MKIPRNFTPAYARVLILLDQSAIEKKFEKAGLVMPDQSRDKFQGCEGVIAAVGETASPQWKVGQRVLFNRFSGEKMEILGPNYLLIQDEDILGSVE